MKWVKLTALALVLCGCSNPETNVAEPDTGKSSTESGAGETSDLRVTLNLVASGYDLKVKVNGVAMGSTKHSDPKFSTFALQLFHEQHENKALAGEENAYLFCLREGKNEMEVSYDLVKPDEVTSLGLRITVYSPTIGLSTPILDFKQEEKKSGHFKVSFDCYEKMPEDFKTVIPKAEQ